MLVIAVLGIVNTLGLSIIERTRELGLLRAIALTRPQVRRMITLESVVIALLGAVVGVGLGTVFGMVLQRLLADQGIDKLSIPWLQLVAFLVAAALVGDVERAAATVALLDAGADDVISCAITPAELEARVSAAVSRGVGCMPEGSSAWATLTTSAPSRTASTAERNRAMRRSAAASWSAVCAGRTEGVSSGATMRCARTTAPRRSPSCG